jgi:hypothetical protein
MSMGLDSDKMQELSDTFNKVMKEIEQDEENFWLSLTKEQQLCCFNAVCRRIYEGELEKKGSYRYILYDIFGFGPEAYARAQMAGFLSLHNSIFDYENEERFLTLFAKSLGVEDNDAAVKAREFIKGARL